VHLDDIAALDLVPGPLKRPIPAGLRIGLIGAGRIVHSGVMPAYRSVGILPVAAADPDPEARQRIQELWGIPRVFADWHEMLDATPLDAVDINLRWDVGLSPMRVAAVAASAERGIHVIIAKPLAETWSQCEEIVRLARDAGIKLGVDQNTRFAPAFYGCRALIRAGALGPLLSATINYHSALGRQHTNAFDAVHDVGVHGIDVLLSWFDREPVDVYASWSRRVDGIGSVLSAVFTFSDGANATLLYDFATRHRRQFEFVAVGEQASADGLQDQELPGPSRMRRATLRVGPHDQRGLALELPLQYALSPESYLATRLDVLQSIGSDREPWASGEHVLRTMRTLFAVKRSIADRQVVSLLPEVQPR
jgi:predicted dehydrogenase